MLMELLLLVIRALVVVEQLMDQLELVVLAALGKL
jgi:hypothetical protein